MSNYRKGKLFNMLFSMSDIDTRLDKALRYLVKAEMDRRNLIKPTFEQFVEVQDSGLRKVIEDRICSYEVDRGYGIPTIIINDAVLYVRYIKEGGD